MVPLGTECIVNKCDSCKLETQQLRSALHFWLKRIHVSSLSKHDQEQFSKDYQLSRGE